MASASLSSTASSQAFHTKAASNPRPLRYIGILVVEDIPVRCFQFDRLLANRSFEAARDLYEDLKASTAEALEQTELETAARLPPQDAALALLDVRLIAANLSAMATELGSSPPPSLLDRLTALALALGGEPGQKKNVLSLDGDLQTLSGSVGNMRRPPPIFGHRAALRGVLPAPGA